MSTAQLKKELHRYLDNADDRMLKIILAMLAADSKNEDASSIKQYNEELDAANDRINAGQFVEHNLVMEEMSEWLKKEK
jgi:predicted transcriptional regulator